MLFLLYQYRLGEQISLVLLELSSVINISKLLGATRSGLIVCGTKHRMLLAV